MYQCRVKLRGDPGRSDLSRSDAHDEVPYNFLKPDKIYEMPEVLKEISGIAVKGNDTLYCVQDELGAVFQYDIHKEEITGMFRFSDVGDFEDLAIRDDEIYVLRSDGTLFRFNYRNFSGKTEQIVVPVPCLDMEGLGYDAAKNLFYIACKDHLIGEKSKDRAIFTITSENMSEPQLALTIKQDEIDLFSKKGAAIKTVETQINPSAIAIHPLTGEIFVLSASDRLVAIYDDGKLTNMIMLPSGLYYKPEGITFTPNGDLYLSSEGIKKSNVNGRIYFFSYLKK
jgi:uncharacterized protein YjiK